MDLTGLGELDEDLTAEGIEVGSLADLEGLSTGAGSGPMGGPTESFEIEVDLPKDDTK